jgi:hypothetical protein
LSTAGLIDRKIHVHAETVENIYNSLARLRVERIDKTGDEKLNRGHLLIVSQNVSYFYF